MDAAAGTAAALPEAWSQVRAPVIVSLLRLAVAVCLTMFVLLFLERLYMAIVIAGVRLFWFRPNRRYRCDPLPEDDLELGSSAFPVVLVQIPMFNERAVSTDHHRSPPHRVCLPQPIARSAALRAMLRTAIDVKAAAGIERPRGEAGVKRRHP